MDNILKNMKTREVWVDSARAILIIFVVMGHFYSNAHWPLYHYVDYVFLFHMPAFFVLSGYLYKPLHKINLKNYICKKFKRLIIPYISYLAIITLIRYTDIIVTDGIDFRFLLKDLLRNAYGGQYLNIDCGVLWFLTCLFFVETIWAVIDSKFKKMVLKIFVVFLFYIIAHIQSMLIPSIKLPLGIDFAFLTLSYYVFGIYFKAYFMKTNVFILSMVLSVTFLILRGLSITHFGFEIAAYHYDNFLLDFIIPIIFSTLIFNLCYRVKILHLNLLSKLGQVTLAVMSLHLVVNNLFETFFNYGIIIFTLVGVVVPYLVAMYFLEKNTILSTLFLGKQVDKKNSL